MSSEGRPSEPKTVKAGEPQEGTERDSDERSGPSQLAKEEAARNSASLNRSNQDAEAVQVTPLQDQPETSGGGSDAKAAPPAARGQATQVYMAIAVAAIGIAGNLAVTWFSGQQQAQLEASRTRLKEQEFRANLIAEFVRVENSEVLRRNLQFLLNAGLLEGDQRLRDAVRRLIEIT